MPCRAQVERAPDPQPLAGLRSHERGRAGDLDGGQVREELCLGGVAVLEVDHDPVQSGTAEELRRAGRAEAVPRAEEGLAGQDAACGGCGGHVRMMPG